MMRKNRYICDVSRRQFLKGFTAFTLSMVNPCSGLCGNTIYGPRSETPARFFTRLTDTTVQCKMCFRKCIIGEGKTGYCRVRINRDGNLLTMSYGNPAALNVDPIEKKPFYHVLPGSRSFSIAAIGCNFSCKFCQNWQIALVKPGKLQVKSMTPMSIAELARKSECQTIAYTYSEPTTWSEYVIDCATEAMKKDIPSVVISNGSMSDDVLTELLPVTKAIKIDLKSIRQEYYRDVCGGELKPVLETIETIHRAGIWLEIVNLIVPTLNDSEAEIRQMAIWLRDHVGTDVPLHFSRFHPMYKLKNLPPTPISTLERAQATAKAVGLKYVYIGNVPKHVSGNTVCPGCQNLLINRNGFHVTVKGLEKGVCKACGQSIPGQW